MIRNLVISFITIVFMLHPKLAEKSIGIFKWIEIEKGVSITSTDTNIVWFSTTHLKWCFLVSLPILILWVCASPITALVLMVKYKNFKNGEGKGNIRIFLILEQGLKPDKFYWEFVNTLRKVLILFSLLFNKSVAITFSLFTLIISARLQVYLKPYK